MRSTLEHPDSAAAELTVDQVISVPSGPERPDDPFRAREPWRKRELIVVGVVAFCGVAGAGSSWYVASDELVWREQVRPLSLGAFSTGLFALACALWVVIGVRRVRTGFAALAAERARVLGRAEEQVGASVADTLTAAGSLVTADAMTRVHRPDCLLMRGKAAIVVDAAGADSYVRCGVCHG